MLFTRFRKTTLYYRPIKQALLEMAEWHPPLLGVSMLPDKEGYDSDAWSVIEAPMWAVQLLQCTSRLKAERLIRRGIVDMGFREAVEACITDDQVVTRQMVMGFIQLQ